MNLSTHFPPKQVGRVALYHRVSTTDQDPEAAQKQLRDAAHRLGLSVTLSVTETGSGSSNDRPGLQRVMQAALAGEVDTVIVWKLDRFGRSALDLLANLRQLEATGTRFISTTQGIDVRPDGDPMSRLLITMLSAVAEFERDLIAERTRLGLERARQRGQRLGRPIAPRPSFAQVQALKAEGATWPQIAAALKCSVWAARMAVKKGAPESAGATAEK